MRPKLGLRRELKGDLVVEAYAHQATKKENLIDDELIITIFDDDGVYGKKDKRTKSGLRRATGQKSL